MAVNDGSASVNVGVEEKKATIDVNKSLSAGEEVVKADKKRDYQFPNVVMNPLEQFASYTAVWTMAALNPEQYNNPIAIRDNPGSLENVILSSAGRYDSQRVRIGGRVAPEYFVSSFTMTSIIVPTKKTGNTNAMGFTFEIFEPYSMGLFLQSMQVAALNAGYVNYLDNCPYLIQLDFLGFNENGDSYVVKNLSKFFIVKLIGITFDTTESGSNYKMELLPHNHQGFNNIINTTFTDIRIQGGTVKDLLATGENSLSVALSKESKRMADNGQIAKPDTYVVTFPTVDGAGSGDNILGQTSMGYDMTRGGSYTYGKESEVISPDGRVRKSEITIDPSSRAFQFGQGQTVTDIITEIILASEFGKKTLENIKSNGQVDWFRIGVKILLGDYDVVRNDYQKTIVYEVFPYKVHSSIFLKPNAAGTGYTELQKAIAKKYNYIYTGANNDLLKFEMKFDTTFYTAISPGLKEESSSTDAAQNSGSDTTQQKVVNQPTARALLSKTASPKIAKDGTVLAYTPGGANNDDVANAVARDFQNAILNSNVDLIEMEFEILGDPYWLIDSGVGNYFSPASSDNPAVTIDGSMVYETSQVYLYVSFRTPIDIDEETGLYDFTESIESPFSGIYMVTEVKSFMSSDAVFKQTISCIRMKGQPSDFDSVQAGTAEDSKPAKTSGEIVSSSTTDPSTPDATKESNYYVT
jgi:hypothetical protein